MVGHPWLHGETAHLCVSGMLDGVCYACSCRVERKWNAFIFLLLIPTAMGHCEGAGELGMGRVGEAGDRRAAEVGIKIPCDKWPQCLCRASCLHLQAATQALPWSLGTTDAWSQFPASSQCVRLFAHIHRSSTNSLCTESTEGVQTVRVFSSL